MPRHTLYPIVASLAAASVILVIVLRRRRTDAESDTETPLPPVAGRVTQGFSSSHRGVDIAVPEGTEVLCPWDGTVQHVWYDDQFGGGRSMLVRHDNGLTTGYAHLEGYHFGSGDRVLRGQAIALSGNSGSHTTGPHLHFTLRNAQGVKIDPQSVFAF